MLQKTCSITARVEGEDNCRLRRKDLFGGHRSLPSDASMSGNFEKVLGQMGKMVAFAELGATLPGLGSCTPFFSNAIALDE